MITTQIDSNLKQAMLTRNELEVSTLKGVKTALQYARVAQGSDLQEKEIIVILQKEVKKRKEAAELYQKAGSNEKHQQELDEAAIIEKYLPAAMSEADIEKLVEAAIAEDNSANMGQIIGKVKARSGGAADGAIIAKIVKAKLN